MARDPIPPPEEMTKEHSPMKVRLQPGEDIREYYGYVINLSYKYSLTLDPKQAPAYRHPLALSYFLMNGLPDCHIFKKLKETYKDLLERNDDGYWVPNHTRYYNVQHHYYKMTAYLMIQKILKCIPEGGLVWNSQGKVVTPGPRPRTRARKRSELEDSTDDEDRPPNQRMRCKFAGYDSESEEEEDPREASESNNKGSKEKETKCRRKYVPSPGDEEEFEEEKVQEEGKKDEVTKELQQKDETLTHTVATNQEENHMEQTQEMDNGANMATLRNLTPHVILLAINLCLTLGSFCFLSR